MPSVPTPAAARYSAAGEPRPPAPSSRTLLSSSLAWPSTPDLGQQQVALVAVALVGGERDGHLPGAALVLPLAEAAGHRHDVGVAELLQGLGGEGRAHAAGAVDDDGGVVVGDLALDLALEVAAGDVEGAGQGALVVLVGLPDVEHDGAGPADGGLGGGGVDLADLGLASGRGGRGRWPWAKAYRPGRDCATLTTD